jgi:UDP-N-acetylmuramyl tripeptide synthase
VTHLAIEASSHGLDQHRLDGLKLSAAAFTNLTHEHLDYHASMDAYFDAKARLFDTLLPEGGTAVVNADSNRAAQLCRDLRPARHPLLDLRHQGQGLPAGARRADAARPASRHRGAGQHA